MTDFTNNSSLPATHKSGSAKREYYTYFAIIFAATLPLAILTWMLRATRQMAIPEQGPIKAAWSQAQIITPRIFSA